MFFFTFIRSLFPWRLSSRSLSSRGVCLPGVCLLEVCLSEICFLGFYPLGVYHQEFVFLDIVFPAICLSRVFLSGDGPFQNCPFWRLFFFLEIVLSGDFPSWSLSFLEIFLSGYCPFWRLSFLQFVLQKFVMPVLYAEEVPVLSNSISFFHFFFTEFVV